LSKENKRRLIYQFLELLVQAVLFLVELLDPVAVVGSALILQRADLGVLFAYRREEKLLPVEFNPRISQHRLSEGILNKKLELLGN